MEKFKLDTGTYLPDFSEPTPLLNQSRIDEFKNQNVFSEDRTAYAQSISMPGPSITDLINEASKLGAESDAILSRSVTPGQTGVGPGYQFDAGKAVSSIVKNLSQPSLRAQTQGTNLGPAQDLERYRYSDDFNTLGYTPNLGSQQEYKYGNAMTWGDTVGKAFAGAGALAAGTFVEGWKGWGRMAEALFTWDASKLMGSEEERYQMAKDQEAIFNKYAIYNTETSEDSLLNRQFFGNMLQQSGFAVGAMAQFALENYLTAGLGKIISAAAEGINTGKALKTLGTTSEMVNATRKAQKLITSSERVTNSLKNLPRTLIPLYGTAQDLTKASRAGAGTLQLAMIGAGGIKRELSTFNMARSEAIFEAASTYKDLENKLVNKFRIDNGREPNDAELERIRQTADDASSDNFYTNVGVLSVMNRIQFDNMFKSFNTTRRIFNEGIADFGDDVLQVTGKVGDKTVRKAYEKGFFGTLGNASDIARTFGKKKAAWELGKGFWRGAQKFEGLEGLQELIQNASNQGLSDYYYDLYHGKKGYDSKLQRVMDNMQNPLTDMEGAKTFLMGALTGRLIAPISYGLGKANMATKEGKEHAAKKAEAIDVINTFYADPTNYVKEQIANVKVQDRAARTMEEAVKNQDRYTFYNAKDSAFAKAVAASIKLNLYDSVKDSLKEFADEMTPEEFKSAFAIEATKVNQQGVNGFIDKITSQMDEYFTVYQNLYDKYGNTIIPDLYKNNSPEEYERVKKAKIAQDAAIEMLATNVFKARQATKRAVALTGEMAANPNIGASSTELITKMGSEQSLANTIFLLKQEISGMEKADTLTKEQRELLDQKKTELSLAEKWKDSYVDIMNLDDENYHASVQERAYKAYGDIINHYNKVAKKDVAISREDIDDNFMRMIDYLMLNRDNKSYIDAMNLLADPYNMDLVLDNLINAQVEFGNRMQEEHKEEVNNIPENPNENVPPVPPAPAGSSTETKTVENPKVDSWYTYQGKTFQIALDEGMVYMMPTNGNEQDGQIISAEEFNKKLAAGEIKAVPVGELKASEKKKEVIPDDLETYLKQQYEAVKKAVEGKGQKLLPYEDWKKTAGVALAKRWQKAQEEKKGGGTQTSGPEKGTSTPVSDIEARKADIEKRRQEEINNRKRAAKLPGGRTPIEMWNRLIDKINAKYDAELARELYKEMKAGKLVTDMTPAEQQVAGKYITEELRKSVDAELASVEGGKTTIQSITPDGFIKPLGLVDINWDSVVFDQSVPGNKRKTNGTAKIIDYVDRKIVVMDVNGRNVPFYLSTGSGGKVNVPAGKWYPFFGIGTDGWFNKLGETEINNYYGSPILKAISEALDKTVGDIRTNTSIPKVGATGSHLAIINKDLKPTENGLSTTRDTINQNIKDLIDYLNKQLPSLTGTEEEEDDDDTSDDNDVKDVNQDINKYRKASLENSKYVNAEYQVGLRQISPNNSLANKTDNSELVEYAPGQFRQERRDVNNNYVFDVATPTFMPSEPVTFRVITEGLDKMTNNITGETYSKEMLFDDKGNVKDNAFDAVPIGVYANIRGEEKLIGTLHEPQWIERKIGSNFVNIAIPEDQADLDYPDVVKEEVKKNRELRKQILENFNKNRSFVVKGIVQDKSVGILRVTDSVAPIKERVNPKIAEGGTDNRHGMFGIIRDGEIQSDINVPVDNILETESFSPNNIANYQGVAVLLLPTPTGEMFPSFIKLPNISEGQAEFIIEAWKAFTGQTNNPEIIKAVYDAMGLVQSADSFGIGVLRNYINHYITYLSEGEGLKAEDKLSRLGTGTDSLPGTARLNITNKGGLELQVKEPNGNWYSTSEPITKAEDLPDDYIAKLSNLRTSVKFTNTKNESLRGINSTEKATILSIKNGKLSKETMFYNEYIMQRAGTFVDKGIPSQNNFGDWVYFANPVVKMGITSVEKPGGDQGAFAEKPPVTPPSMDEINKDRPDKGAQLLAALRAKQLSAEQVEEQKKNCSLQDKLKT